MKRSAFLLPLGLGHAVDPHAVLDVLLHRHPVEGGVALEHHAARLVRTVDLLAVEEHRAAGRIFEPRDQAEHGGFAAARGAEQRANLSFLHVERHIAHGLDRRPVAEVVALADAAHRQLRHSRRR